MDRSALYSFIRVHRYGVVASVGENGKPESELVGIATTLELEIVFDTVKTSRKYGNLIARPRWPRYSDYGQKPPLIEEVRLV
jgi:hypothetical protein